MLSIRVYFKKKGILSYISHLDLNRTIMRAIQRAEIPIVYSEGFNPHPRLVFNLPLSLFHESETEIFDFRIECHMEVSEIEQRLRESLPSSVEIVKVTTPIKKLSEIAFSEYKINLFASEGNTFDEFIDLYKLFEGDIVVRKKTKKTEKDINISSMIKKIDFTLSSSNIQIEAVLDTSSKSYLNPIYIVNYLENYFNFDEINILRTKFYDSEMKEFE